MIEVISSDYTMTILGLIGIIIQIVLVGTVIYFLAKIAKK